MPDHLGTDQRKTKKDPEDKEKEDFQGLLYHLFILTLMLTLYLFSIGRK
jgi:hypothetical protein